MHKDHETFPLLSASKWESQEGCYAYVKAYMYQNSLKTVRVCTSTYESCFYMILNNEEFKLIHYKCDKDMSAPSVNHYTDEVIKLAKTLGFIPEEEDVDSI